MRRAALALLLVALVPAWWRSRAQASDRTARFVAATRHVESLHPRRLFDDPYARHMYAGSSVVQLLADAGLLRRLADLAEAMLPGGGMVLGPLLVALGCRPAPVAATSDRQPVGPGSAIPEVECSGGCSSTVCF